MKKNERFMTIMIFDKVLDAREIAWLYIDGLGAKLEIK